LTITGRHGKLLSDGIDKRFGRLAEASGNGYY